MPTGIWIIESTPPPNAVKLGDDYLPSGTRVRVLIQGPTTLALTENRTNELAVDFGLLPPVTPALCQTGLAVTTDFGTNLCADGQPRPVTGAQANAPIDFEAFAVFDRLTAKTASDPEQAFFAERGARAGARFMTLTIKYKAAIWRLWLRSPTEMVAECVAVMPGKNNVDSYPMVWRKAP